MTFKCISYLELWQPFSSAERNHFVQCLKRVSRGTIIGNYFEFWSVAQEEMSFKRVLIWSSSGPPVQRTKTIYAILEGGIMGNIHVKLYEIRTSGSGGDVI